MRGKKVFSNQYLISMKQRTNELYFWFKKWMLSDNVIKLTRNTWVEQCSQYRIEFTFSQIYRYWRKNYGYQFL